MTVMKGRRRWDAERRADAYSEREHPSDLFLEIRGRDPGELAENALFAFYDQIAELEGFDARREVTLRASATGLDEALRSLLAEALYLFDTERFVATGGDVETRGPGEQRWELSALLWGEDAHPGRHSLLREVKAITYHQLTAVRSGDGWTATVLLDL